MTAQHSFAPPSTSPNVGAAISEAAKSVEIVLESILPPVAGPHGRVLDAMRYAVFAGGKRLRPYITVASAKLFGVAEISALRTAAAIEVLHTYSLVHDDLPCMDNDDLRRGQPTTHRKFDETTAVLAGDGLLTFAFEILAEPETHPSADVRVRLVSELAKAAGALGMIGGQMMDMQAAQHRESAEDIILLQQMKTGALFEFSAVAGALLGERPASDQDRLRKFAQSLGLAFQIADDLIDASGDTELAGKSVGKDEAQGKATLVTLYGLEGAKREALRLAEEAARALEPYGDVAEELRGLPYFLLDRVS